MRRFLKAGRRVPASLTLLLLLIAATPATAFQFTLGEVEGSLDTTVSYGLSYRTAERDKDIIGIANGGRAYSVNSDDGNLNYNDDEYFSKLFKVTSDLEMRYQNFGLFLRGTAFHDFVNSGGDGGERTEITDGDALDLIGEDAKLLDAYLWWDFEVGGMPGSLKVGKQVLSWGESTFVANGINVINPVDVSMLRLPGSELKEALIPVGMVSASLAINENISIEGFYQYDWESTDIDPVGSYWSGSDIVGDGGDRVLLGFGKWSDQGETWGTAPVPWAFLGYPTPSGTDPSFNMVPRGPNVYADNDGQYGLAMHLMVPQLNSTEFGLFYMNYHSRLPVISAKTGTVAGRAKAAAAGAAANALGSGVATALNTGRLTGMALGLSDAEARAASAGGVNAFLMGNGIGGLAEASAYARGFATNEYAQTAQYFTEYPEDIQLFGASFNTQFDSTGIALQGEYSYRKDAPLQVDDVELLFAALSPINSALGTYGQLGAYGLDQTINGYEEMDISQVQFTATKAFGPTFGADQFTFVGEIGLTHVHGMPDKDKLRFESPGTFISGNQILGSAPYNAHAPTAPGEHEDSSAFADATSWGYRAIARLDFNNAIGAVTLSPRIAWAHDVDGNSPNPGGNFLEHRKAITYGIGADYQNTWSADLSYTDFFGAGRYNLINDRDFISFNVKYSF